MTVAPQIYFTPTMAKLALEQLEAYGVEKDQLTYNLERQSALADRKITYTTTSWKSDHVNYEAETPLLTFLKSLETPFASRISLFESLQNAGVIREDSVKAAALETTALAKFEQQHAQARTQGDSHTQLQELKLPEAQAFILDLEKLRDLAQPIAGKFTSQVKSR